jgi:hypothetical protein
LAVKQPDKRTVLNALIAKYLVVHGYTKPNLAVLLSMSTASLYNKLNNPNMFTLKELRRLFEVLKFSQDEILDVI